MKLRWAARLLIAVVGTAAAGVMALSADPAYAACGGTTLPVVTATPGATAGSINLSWTAVTGATSYGYRADTTANGITTATTISNFGSTATTATITTTSAGAALTAGTSYTIAVSGMSTTTSTNCTNNFGTAPTSNTTTAVATTTLAAPTGVTVTGGATSASLSVSWTASSNAAAAQKYSVKVYSNVGLTTQVGTTLTGQTSPASVTSGLTAGTAYWVTVTAEASTGYVASAASTAGTGTATTQLAAPTGVTASPTSTSGSMSVSWTASSNAVANQKYSVKVYSDVGLVTQVGTTATGQTSPYVATGLTVGTAYWYTVTAEASTGFLASSASTAGTATTQILLTTPTAVTAVGGASLGTVSISWTGSSNAPGGQLYTIKAYTDAGLTTQFGTSKTGQTSPYTFTGLSAGTTYYFTVTAEAGTNYVASAATAGVSAKATQTLVAPTSVTVTGGASTGATGSISVTWVASTNAAAGQLYTLNVYSDIGLSVLVKTVTGVTSPNVVTGLTAGTTYYVTVTAQASTGYLVSAASTAASGDANIQLQAPTAVTVVGGTSNATISVSWVASSNAAFGQTYTVNVFSNVGLTTLTTTLSGQASPVVVTGLTAGTQYWVTVTAEASTGYLVSAASTSGTGRATQQLVAPTGVTAVSGNSTTTSASVSVTWTASSNAAAGQTYTLYAYTDAALTQLAFTTTGLTSPATMTGLTAGTTYWFVVSAEASVGYLASADSSSSSAIATIQLSTPVVTVVGGTSSTTQATLNISWTASTNAAPGQLYNVVVYSNAGRTTVVSTNNGVTSPITVSGLTAGTTYYIGVTAAASTGYVASAVSASVNAVATIQLVAPTAVTVTPSTTTSGSFQVIWTASTNAVGGQLYTVRIYSDAGLTTLVGAAITGRTSPYTATGLTAGTTYYVTVTADASAGYVASSASSSGSGMATVQLSAPTGVAITAGPASGQITVTWTAPANAAPGQLYTVMVYSNAGLTTQVGAARTGLTSGSAITGLTTGTTYWVTVIAQVSTGYLVSAASTSATGTAQVQLVAPTNITVNPGATLNSLTVSWTPSTNAAGTQTYTIRVYANAGLTTLVNTFTGQASGATVSTSLTGGVQYWVTVSADASTNYLASAASSGVGPTVATQTLSTPTAVTVVGGGAASSVGSIIVTWTGSTNAAPGQTYTVIVYSNAGRTTVVSTNPGLSSGATISGLTAGTTYYVGVTATASAGYLVSAMSASANGIATVTVQAPTGVTVSPGATAGSAVITWTASSNAAGAQTYTVRIYSDAGLTTLVGTAITGRTSPYSATGLTLGTQYWVTITADASTGYVASVASIAGTGTAQVQLAAPTSVSVVGGATVGSIRITWTASSNAVAGQTYTVTVYSDPARTVVVGSPLTGQASGVIVTGLTEGTTYYVGVVAESSTNYLASTVSTSANGKATVQLSAPTGVTVVGGNSTTSAGSITVTWVAPGNAAPGQTYTVYVYTDSTMTTLAIAAQTGKTSPFTATGLTVGSTYYVQVVSEASTGYLVSVSSVEGVGVATIALQAPTAVTVSGGTSVGTVNISWTSSSNAASGQTYSINVYSNAGLTTLVTTLVGQTSPVVVTGLTAGTSYWFTVVAEGSGSYVASNASTSATTKSTQQLTAPTNVTVTGGNSTTTAGSISVTWTASSNAISGQLYTVVIYSDSGLTTVASTQTGKTSPLSVTGLVAGTTYYVVVTAEATAGNLVSAGSTAGSGLATIQLSTPTGAAVSGGASTTSTGSISVSWTSSTNAAPGQTYTIVVYSNAGRTTVVSTWAGKTSPFIVTGLTAGTTYYVGITADASTGYVTSAQSASASGAANIQLQAPTTVTVVGGATLGSISVSWTAASNAAPGQLYSVYVYSNVGLTTQVGTTTTGATSPVTISGLTAGTTYWVTVVAQASAGYLVSTASASGTGAATQTLNAPTGVTVTGGGSTTSTGSLNISWTASSNAAPNQTYTVIVYSNSTRTTVVSTNAGVTSPFTATGLTAGTTYYIGITATASTGYLVSAASASANGIATIQLQAPTNVTLTPSSTSGSIAISWTASSNAAVSQRYTVRIYSDSTLTTLVGTAVTGQVSPYTATGLTVGTQYWFTVSADASAGTAYLASAQSTSATTVLKIQLSAPTGVTVAPGNLPGSISISWTASANAIAGQTYTITVYSDAARTIMMGSPITGQTSPLTVSPLQLVALGEGVTYYVVVSADATGNYLASANSTAASGKTTVQLVPPTAIVFGPGNTVGTAVISWTASANAAPGQTYTVRIYSDAAQTILVGSARTGLTSPYTATGLTVGTQYWVTVSADAQTGYLASVASDFGTDFVTVQLAAPTAVTVVGGNALASAGSIVVSFTPSSNAAPGQVYTVTIYYTSARNTIVATTQTTSTSVTFTGLGIGATYYVGIVAEASTNYLISPISALASGAATVQLLAPASVTVAPGLTAGSITITWTASANAAANQTYSVYVYNSAAQTTLVASSLARSLSAYNVTGLTQGATYYVVVIADGSPSYVASASSATFSGNATVQLTAPTTVVAAGGAAVAATGSLTVTFVSPINAAAGQTYTFKVYSNVGLTTLVGAFTGKTSGSVVTGLAIGTTYWVTVTAEASTGYLVSTASASSSAVANTTLAAPTAVTVVADATAGAIRVTWASSSNAAGAQTYSVRVFSDAALLNQVGTTVAGVTSGYTVSGLTQGATYYVVVLADASGSYLASGQSLAGSGRATIQLAAPTSVVAVPGTLAGSIAVTFSASSNAAAGQTYTVSIFSDSAHTILIAQQTGVSAFSAQLTGLTQGAGYFAVVVAEASSGYLASAESAHSANFATVQLDAPTTVTVLGGNSTTSFGSVLVEWISSANAAFGQTYSVAIYSDAARTQLVGTVLGGQVSPVTITGLIAGHTYYAVVIAEASVGFLTSANSTAGSGMANIKIQAPTGVTVNPGSASGSIIVSFTGSSNAMVGQKYTVVVWGDSGLSLFITSADLVSGSPVTITGLPQTTSVYVTVFAESAVIGFDASDDSAAATGRVKTTLTVRAVGQSLLYGDATPSGYTYTTTGFFEGDTFVAEPTCSLAPGVSYAAGSDAGNYQIVCSSASASGEYNLAYTSANLIVAKRHLTFTADAASAVYGDAVPDFSVTDGGDGIFGFDSFAGLISCDTTYARGSNAGTYPIACSGPSSTTNYVIDGYYEGTLTVAKRQINIIANDHGIAFGDSVPTLNITVGLDGLFGTDALVTEPTCSTTYVQGDALGTYAIVCSGAVATSNYEIAGYVAGTITVDVRVVTITVGSLNIHFGEAAPTSSFSYVTTDAIAGDPLWLVDPVCTTDYSQGDNAGTYTITCVGTQVSGINIRYVAGRLTVAKRTVTFTPDALTVHYGDAITGYNYALSGMSLYGSDDLSSLFTCASVYAQGSSAGTYTIACTGSAGNTNYAISYGTSTLTVLKRAITVTANDLTVTHGDANPAYSSTLSGDGLFGSDNLNGVYTCSTSGYSIRTHAGSYALNCSGLASTTNYAITYVAGTLTVNKKDLTITANPATVTYGNAAPSYSSVTSGLVADESLTTSATCTVAGYSVTTHVGTYQIVCSGAVQTDYNISYAPANLTVTKRALVITAADKSVVYANAPPAFTSSTNGLVNSDSLTTAATCVALDYTTLTHVGTTAISCSGAVQSDYEISYVPASLTITKRALNIAADAKSVVYGTDLVAYTFTPTGLVNGDSLMIDPSCAYGSYSALTHVGTYSIVCLGASQSDYEISYTAANLTVTKRSLTVTASDRSVVYGNTIASHGYSTSGFINGDAFSTTPICSSTYSSSTPVVSSPVAITCDSAAQSDYAITYIAGSVNIGQRTVVATSNASVIYGDAVPSYVLAAADFVNGETWLINPTCTSVYNDHTSVGSYAVNCNGGSVNSNYAISYVAGAIVVSPKALVLTANSHQLIYGSTAPTYGFAVVGLTNGDIITVDPTCTSGYAVTAHVGHYAISCASASAGENYTISYVEGTVTVSPRELLVTGSSHSIIYGSGLPSYYATPTGLVNGDGYASAPICSSTYNVTSHVGSYAVTCEFTPTADYVATFVEGSVSVAKRNLTVAANDHNVAYSTVISSYGTTSTGFVNGDSFTVDPTCASPYVTTSSVGTYAITCAAAEQGDYEISYVSGTVTVVRKSLVISAVAINLTYGDAVPIYEFTDTGFGNGESYLDQPVCDTNYTNRTAAGTLTIVCSGAVVSDNYLVSYETAVLTIAKRDLFVTANSKNLLYGTIPSAYSQVTTGFVNGDAFSQSPTCSSAYTRFSSVGSYDVVCSGAAQSNYSIHYVNGAVNVAKRNLTIAANAVNLTYGDDVPLFDYAMSGLINGDVFVAGPTCDASYSTTTNVGSYTIACAGAAQPNYNIIYVDAQLTVAAYVIRVVPANQTVTYGDNASISYSYTIEPLINGDQMISLPECSSSYTPSSGAGTIAINCVNTNAGSNYRIVVSPASVTVNKRALSVYATDASVVYGSATAALGFTTSGFVNSDSFTTNPTCSANYQATTGVGEYVVTCSGGVQANYNINYYLAKLTVAQRPLTIFAVGQSIVYGTPLGTLTAQVSGLVNNDRLTTDATCVSAYSVTTAAGQTPSIECSGAVQANYSISYVPAVVTVTVRELTITAGSFLLQYGDAVPDYSMITAGFAQGEGFVGGVNPTCYSTYSVTSSVGTYATSCFGGSVSSNYNVTYVAGSVTVTKRSITVIADDKAVTYANAGPTYTYTLGTTNFVNGQGFSTLPSCTFAYTTLTNAGTYDIVCRNASLGAYAANYDLTYQVGHLTVARRALTVTATDAPSTSYGDAAPNYSYSASGFVNGDSFTSIPQCSYIGYTTRTTVGTYAITCANAVQANYQITYAPGTLTVVPRALTVSANAKSVAYGDAAPAYTYTATGFVNSDSFTTSPLCNAVVGAGTYGITTPAGSYNIVCSGGVQSNYSISYVTGRITVNPKRVTITADYKFVNYGDPLPGYSFVASSLINGDSFTTNPMCVSSYSRTSPVGTYAISCAGAVQPNYLFFYVDGSVTVAAKPITVTATDASKEYGDALPTFTYTTTGFANSENFTVAPICSTSATASTGVGSYVINCSGAILANYQISYVAGTLSISRKTVLITAKTKNLQYGDAVPVYDYNATGLNSVNVTPAFTTQPTCSASYQQWDTPLGSTTPRIYAISCSGAVGSNYNITYASGAALGQVVLSAKSVNVTPTAINITYGQTAPTVSFTEGSLLGSDAFISHANCSVTYSQYGAAGTYPIVCSGGSAGPNYNFVYVPANLTVAKKALTVNAVAASVVYGSAVGALTPNTAGFINGDGFTTAPTCTTSYVAGSSHVGTLTITCSGAVQANYEIAYNTALLTITQKPLTVTADAKSVVYGGANPGPYGYTSAGFVGSDAFSTAPTCSVTYATTTPAGSYPIVCSGAVAADYLISYAPVNLVVTPAALTVTADDLIVNHGDPIPNYTATATGFINGDGFTTAPTCSSSYTPSASVGTLVISCRNAVSPNYTITYATGTLRVGRPSLVITANPATYVYGAAKTTLTYTITGLITGDHLTTSPSCTSGYNQGSGIGEYAITCYGAVIPNYDITYVDGILTVNKRSLTITPTAQYIVYGDAPAAPGMSANGFFAGDGFTVAPSCTASYVQFGTPGTYPITCSGAVADNYNITYGNGSIVVSKLGLTVQAESRNITYGDAYPTGLSYTATGFIGNETFTTAPTCSTTFGVRSPAGTYSVICTGGVQANYAITYVAGTLRVAKKSLMITANPQSITYGDVGPGFTYTATPGLIAGDSFTTAPRCAPTSGGTSFTYTTRTHAGSYGITCAGAVQASYDISYSPSTFVVAKHALQIAAKNISVTYGTPGVPAFDYIVGTGLNGFVNGDSLTSLPNCAATYGSRTPAGNYDITCTPQVEPDYEITYVTGTLTVTPRNLSVTVTDKSMVYGSTLPAFVPNIVGLLTGDLLTAQPACAPTASTFDVGVYAVSCSGAVQANYNITYGTANLTVTAKPLTVTTSRKTIASGDNVPTNFVISTSGFVGSDNFTVAPTCTTTYVKGNPVGDYSVDCTGGVQSNYAITYTAGVLTVSVNDPGLSVFTVNGVSVLVNTSTNAANGTTSVTVVATPKNTNNTVVIHGDTGLVVGPNTITVEVFDSNGVSLTTFNATVVVAPAAITPIVVNVPAGSGAFYVNGVLQTNITPTPVTSINQIRVSGSGWLTTVSATTKTGAVLPLVGGGLAVTAGSKFNFMSTGYLPNTSVNVYVMSTPQLLGSFTTDANGNLFVSVTLPTTLANGGHTIQLNGIDKSGYVRSASLGFGLTGATSGGGTNGGGTNGGGTVTAKTVTLKAFFTFGSVALTSTVKAALKGLAATVKKASVIRIAAVGMTRNVGTTAVDLATATKRAQAVVAYLKGLGVNATYVAVSATGPGAGDSIRRVDIKATYK